MDPKAFTVQSKRTEAALLPSSAKKKTSCFSSQKSLSKTLQYSNK